MATRSLRGWATRSIALVLAAGLVAACGGSGDSGSGTTAQQTTAGETSAAQTTDGPAGGDGTTDESPPSEETSEVLDYPTQTISLIVGFAPGGGADVFSRALVQAAAGTLPQRIVVENREGGGGTSASAFVLTQPADGYTILFGHAGSSILTPTISESVELKWDNFAPVARIHAEEEFLFLRPDSQWSTIEEVMEYAGQNPGAVRVGGSAVGGIDSLVIILLEQQAGVDFTYVPFDGGGPASLSFLGGNVDVLVGNYSDNAASIEAGEMFPIAVASAERGSQPDVPTLAELGWEVDLQQWRGIFAPKGTPEDRLQILANGLAAALDEQAWVDYRESSNSVDRFLGPAEFGEFLAAEEARLVPIIEELGLIGG